MRQGPVGDSAAGPKVDRNDALINGALLALGLAAIVDNVVAHWLLGLHRALPEPWAGPVEAVLVVLGGGMFVLGFWREKRARRR